MELIAHHASREFEVHVERTYHGYQVRLGDAIYDVDVASAGEDLYTLLIGGDQQEVSVARQNGDLYQVTSRSSTASITLLDPLTDLAQKAHGAAADAGQQLVTAYMPGRVVEILAEEGSPLEAGQGVLVLEAMKMKNEIQTERGGVIKRLLVEAGQTVEGGDPLFEIE